MTAGGNRRGRLRAMLPMAVCSLPLLILVAVMIIRWIG